MYLLITIKKLTNLGLAQYLITSIQYLFIQLSIFL